MLQQPFQKEDELDVHSPDAEFIINGKTCTMHPMRVGDAAQFLRAFARIRNIMMSYTGPSVTLEDVAKQFPIQGLRGEELKAQIAKRDEAIRAIPDATQRIDDDKIRELHAEVAEEILPMLPYCLEGIDVADISVREIQGLIALWLAQNMNDEILKNWSAVDDLIRERSVRVADFDARSHLPERSND